MKLLLKYKIFGSLSLILAAVYIVINNIGDKKIYHHAAWALVILLSGIIQLYDSFILDSSRQSFPEEQSKDENEKKPLIKEEYPLIKQFTKKLGQANIELNNLKNDEAPKNKELFNIFNKEIDIMLKIKNNI